jgi:polyhydroxyalkanoate synthesis repressor PhaR
MKTAKVVIKKYGNRRLYDTSSSRYVNLDDIAAMVRNGTEVQVVDAKTGADLTQVTLTQVILESSRDQSSALPLELLRELIVTSDHVGREFITWYLKSAFDAYHKVQNTVESGFTDVQAAVRSPFDTLKKFVQGPAAAPSTEASEVEELRRRLSDLEARLNKPKRGTKKARKQTA